MYRGFYARTVLLLVAVAALFALVCVLAGRLRQTALWAVVLTLLLLQLAALAAHLYITRRNARRFQAQLRDRLRDRLGPDIPEPFGAGGTAMAYGHAMQLLSQDIENEYKERLLNREAKLNMLQSQINPHFLYNTLDSIRSDVVEAGLVKPAEMLHELAQFFRYSISEKKAIISLREEIKNVDTFMSIMQYRFGSRVVLMKYVDAQDEDLMEFQMPKMILQPLVENAIQHGLESRLGEGLIVLHAYRTDRFVELVVQDDGVGMDAMTLEKLRASVAGDAARQAPRGEKQGGLALPNVDRRLKLCFGEQYGLSISSDEGIGTEIRVLMPVMGGNANAAHD